MVPLVDELTAAGVVPGPGECYSFKTPPLLGGAYSTDNVGVLPIAEHFGVYGPIHEQLRHLSDGALVELKFVP